jgi:leader peptidase (prepilin peptidase)/N-methyltransferase
MIRIFGTIFAGLLGLAFGSFLNVCLSRWPEGESIVRPRSHCRSCGHTLSWWENIPLVSWARLRGRCHKCRAWIGWRYQLVELAVGGVWATTMWSAVQLFLTPDSPAFTVYSELVTVAGKLILCWLLVGLAVLDAENLWLPDWITLPGTVLGLVIYTTSLVLRSLVGANITIGTIISTTVFVASLEVLGILAAAGLILLIRWTYLLIRRREGIGLGDAKLMALLAAWLGLPQALLAFALGVVLGALVGVLLLAVPSARNHSEGWAASKLPLGTFLCIGGIVSALWGQPILAAYLRWSGF